jgi:hypothetical protein
MTKAQERAAEVLANRKAAYLKKVHSLLGHLARNAVLKEADLAFRDGRSADDFAAEVAAREPVGKAVHALKADAVASAELDARDVVERVRTDLEAHGWDVHAVAPYPSNRVLYDRAAYARAKAKYGLYNRLIMDDPKFGYQGSRSGDPRIVVINPTSAERFVNEAREMAAANYDAFIVKLVGKTGKDVVSAKLDGNHVWGHSTLIIIRKDGRTERWFTQQIVNYSGLGTPYNQWPTRLLK